MPPKKKENAKPKKSKPVEDVDSDESMDDITNDGPPAIDPYEVLEIGKEATADEVKKAYRKKALAHHPDKAKESEKAVAHTRFQEIAFAYAILSDDVRRKRYDTTGRTDESLVDDDDFNWSDFFRAQYAEVVTAERINNFQKEYRHSAEERRDILSAYTKYKGKLKAVYESVMFLDILEDDDRVRKMLDEEIRNGTIDEFPAYAKETDASREKAKAAERKFREREAGEAEEAKADIDKKKKKSSKKDKQNDMGDLAALIASRHASREANSASFFANLEAKYAQPGKGGKGKKRATPMDEPPEEAFAANRKRGKKAPAPEEAEAEEEVNEQSEEEVQSKRSRGKRGGRKAKA